MACEAKPARRGSVKRFTPQFVPHFIRHAPIPNPRAPAGSWTVHGRLLVPDIPKEHAGVTRDEIVERIRQLNDEDFARVAPYLAADLDVVDHDRLRDEVVAGRGSAATAPLLSAKDVYDRARNVICASRSGTPRDPPDE